MIVYLLYQNETIMKSAVFTSAWKMFRELGITFSSALKLSWANEMADKLSIERDIAEGISFNRPAVKRIEAKLNGFIKTLNTLMPCEISFVKKPYNNSGAEHYYGIGVYNGD